MEAKASHFVADPNALYRIMDPQGNLAFTAVNDGSFVKIQAYTKQKSQHFQFQSQGGTSYLIKSPDNNNHIHTKEHSGGESTKLVFNDYKGMTSSFSFPYVTQGPYAGKAVYMVAISNKRIVPNYQSYADGRQVVITGIPNNFTWVIQKVEENFKPEPTALYRIASLQDENLVFTAYLENILRLYTYTGVPIQHLYITYESNKKHRIQIQNKSYSLSVAEDSNQDLANLQFAEGTPKGSYFDIVPVPNGTGYYIYTFNGKVFDARGGTASNGGEVVQHTFHGKTNQIWTITKIA